jgi:hypothetical protein
LGSGPARRHSGKNLTAKEEGTDKDQRQETSARFYRRRGKPGKAATAPDFFTDGFVKLFSAPKNFFVRANRIAYHY